MNAVHSRASLVVCCMVLLLQVATCRMGLVHHPCGRTTTLGDLQQQLQQQAGMGHPGERPRDQTATCAHGTAVAAACLLGQLARQLDRQGSSQVSNCCPAVIVHFCMNGLLSRAGDIRLVDACYCCLAMAVEASLILMSLLHWPAAGAKPPGGGYGYGAPPQGGYQPYGMPPQGGMPPGGMVQPPGGMVPQGAYHHQQHMQRGGRGPQHPPGGYQQQRR